MHGQFMLSVMVFILTAAGVSGQTPSPGTVKAGADYSKESFIIERLLTVSTFENDGTSSRTTTSAVRVQSEAGVQHWGVLSVGYSTTNEQVEIGYVRVRKADGTVVETPADSAQDLTSEIMRVAPMYSDYHEKHVAVKGLGAGDVLEYQVTTLLHTPLIPGQFWFGYDFEKANVVLDEEVEVNVPKDRELKIKSRDLKPTIVENGNRRVYTWKTANLEVKKDDEPRREFPPPAILLSSFKSWEEMGHWWSGLEQQAAAPTPEIRAKAAELTRNATTREEKVRALYDYVATRFRYISMSFGIGRYQPHPAVDVLKNEYGDCKDKHTLLASLLAAVGIDAYPALTNSTRHIDPDVPSPGQFDHVITAVPESQNSSKLIWLDTTTEVAPFGYLVFVLRDKQALLIPGAAPPQLATTPPDPPFKSFQRYEIDAKLSDTGVLEGTMHRTFRGDSELIERMAFRQTPQSQWQELVQGICRAMGFAGDVSDVEVSSPEVTTEPFHFSNKYTRKNYPDWANHRITPPLGFWGLPEIKEGEKRTLPILLGGQYEVTSISRVQLPKGYTPKLLANVDQVWDFAEYHSKYSFEDGVWVTEVHVIIKKLEIPLTSLAAYQSFQKTLSDNQNLYTELSNGSAPAPPQPYVFTFSPNGDATGLLLQAQAALQRRDLDDAYDLLERALKLDDHYKAAWLMLGTVQLSKGQMKEGEADLRKGIAIDPEDAHGYVMLAYAYMHERQPEQAIAVWQDLLKHDPNNTTALINLGDTLLSLKRYGEAIPVLESAQALIKSSAPLEIALANAYLGAGKPDQAAPLLKDAADTSLSPMVWNDVAYTLADHNLNLPVAQTYAEKAVQSLEHDAANVDFDHLEKADLNRMKQLGNDWDTLGWVYFREGDFARAQKYLEAAWNLYQDRVIGEHLAQVYEKLGKTEAAKHQYILAHGFPDLNEPAPFPEDQFGRPTVDEHMSAVDELSEMRHTELGRVSKEQGSAEFFILLAPGGKVGAVKFISGDENIRPLSKVLASLKLKAPLPDDAPVKIIRRGVLMCNGYNLDCDFTLSPVEDVQSTH